MGYPMRRGVERVAGEIRSGLWTLVLAAIAVSLFVVPAAAEENGEGDATSALLSPSIEVSPGVDVPLGTPIVADASGSEHRVTDVLVDEVRYTWDLGDGTVRVGDRIPHSYDEPGTYRLDLTMEVFETEGIFHRATESVEVSVRPAELPKLVAVIDLESGFARPGTYAALVRIDDRFLLIEQEHSPVDRVGGEMGSLFRLPDELEGLAVSGGLASIGDLRLGYGSLSVDLSDGVLVFVAYGTTFGAVSFSLTERYAAIEHAGYGLFGTITRADHVAVGLGYEVAPPLVLLGALGLLHLEGAYEGNPRVVVEERLLPTPFSTRMVTLSLGVGVQIGRFLLALQAMVVL